MNRARMAVILLCAGILLSALVWQSHSQDKGAINCIIVLQYTPDTPKADQEKGIASNDDLLKSANALALKLGKDETVVKVVTSTSAHLPETIESFTKDKKCCKRIEIVSHGNPDGSLSLPYRAKGADDLPERDRDALGRRLGGPAANNGFGADRLKEFTSALTKAFCKLEQPTVTLHTCWSGVADGIAAQVAKLGVRANGYTAVCRFDHAEDINKGKKEETWASPRPKEGSEVKTFEPKNPEKKKPANQP